MRRALVLAVAASLPPVTAAAQSTSWHGVLNGDVAVTDNVFATPDLDRDGDVFFQLRPGFFISRNAPRMIHTLLAEAEIVHYALNSRIPSVSGRLGWNAFFLPGPRSEVVTSVSGSTGILTSLQSRSAADETMINVSPVGKVTFRQADASEYFSWIATRELRLSQRLFGRYNRTSDNADELEPPMENTITSSAEAGIGLALERVFRSDALALEIGGSISRLERQAPATALEGSRLDRQISPRGSLQWRHDIDRRLSFGVDGGLVYMQPFGTDPYNPMDERQSGYFPVVGAQFTVADVWGRGTMSVRRDVAPNVFLAQNTVNDTATVSAAVPLPWLDNSHRRNPKLVGLGAVSVQRTQLIDSVTSDTESSIGAARVDVAVIYAAKPGLSYAARYELVYQTGDDEAEVPIQGFFRNTVYFTVNIRYPSEVAGTVPRRRAGGSNRADRSDQAPLGAEPVVPDILDDGGGGEPDQR